ncbi:MAG: hypothetical protein J5937_02570 [Paludibacteraceae bacterium]|nr:hypothetical protein [Paludibacteraceae bacterium]
MQVAREWLKYAAVLLLLVTIGVGNVWADYTIIFKDGSGTDAINASTLSNFINSGTSYVTSASSSYMYPSATTGYGIRLASGSYAGNLTLNLSETGKIKASKITFNAAYYSSDASTMPYTITYTDNTTTTGTISTLSTSLANKEVSLTSTKTIKTIYIGTTAKKKRVYVHSITVTAAAAATPTVTPDPTSLDWGTVLQGSSQSTKTISISGSNLTAGSLTISATGGYSVTPTSKGVSGTLSATTLTITPPSTATAGTKNGKVTISGGGLASNVEVNLTMTVQALHTVTWMVNGSEYATTVVANGGNPVFPSSPTSCDADKVFVGWTETNIGSTETNTAPSFITTATTISSAKTYYAVFAKRGTFTRVTSPSSLASGQELVIVSNKYNTAITTGIGYAAAPTESSSKVTPSEAMIWLLTGNSSDGWRISKPSNGYVLGASSSPSSNNSTTATLTSNNTYSTWGIGQNSYTSNVLYISYKITVSCALEASSASSNWVVYNSSSYNSNQYCALRVYASSLTKYVTECCTPLAQVNGSVNLSQWNAGVHIY